MNRRVRAILAFSGCIALSGLAYGHGGRSEFEAKLKGANEVPPVATPIRANINLKFNKGHSVLKYELRVVA